MGDNTSIDLSKKQFEDNIKFLHVYSAGTKHNLLELILDDYKLKITAYMNNNTNGRIEMKIDNVLKFRTGINSQYVIEALRQIKSDEIELQLTSEVSPIIIKDENTQHLILPVRLSQID